MMREHIYKQYVVLGTKWNKDLLFRAWVKLTLAYVGVSSLILGIFSYLLYRALLVSLEESIELHVQNVFEQMRLFKQAEETLRFQIITVDSVILVVVCVCAYIITEIALRPIREAQDRERRFFADAAHELRTPLSVMKSGTEVVLRGEVSMPARVKQVLTENIEEIDSLTRIANGLLALVSGREKIVYDTQHVDAPQLLAGIVRKLCPLADAKHVELSLHVDTTLAMVFVQMDQADFIRTFENIIENGIKYTQSQGTVAVMLTCKKEFVVIQIKDSGIGIASDDLPHVTEPFFRADLARTSNEGSGLGLSIVSETINAMGGTFSIESALGVGTTVTVTLPISKVQASLSGVNHT